MQFRSTGCIARWIGRSGLDAVRPDRRPEGTYPVPGRDSSRKRVVTRITRKAVDALSARDREYMLWDCDIKGFGVRVHPSGRKVYLVKYRHQGRVIKKTIGPHDAIPPTAARARAAEIITVAKTGRDLMGRVLPIRKDGTSTMHDLAERFLEEYVPAHCKPSSAQSYEMALRRHVLPRLGNRGVAAVTRSDVATLHQQMRGIPYAANRTIGILSAMFTVAELWGLRPEGSNPCRHVKRFREQPRERFLSDVEYRRLGAALREAESTGAVAASAIARGASAHADRLPAFRDHELALGECRSGGGGATAARQQDGGQGGASRRPGGRGCCAASRARRGNPWVITGRRPGSRLASLHFPWGRIRRSAGLEDVRLHDLRHSFASGGLLIGEGLPMIGKLLGHSQVQTTARYAHLADNPVKTAANRIARRIAEIAG